MNARAASISNSPKREPKAQTQNFVGPGTYDVAKSMAYLKPRPPEIDFAPSEHRRALKKTTRTERLSFKAFSRADSRNYSPKPFGSDTTSFKIGERLKEVVNQTPGPGTYSTDLTLQKVRNPMFKIDSGPSRPDLFTKKKEYHAESGLYNTMPDFGANAKSFNMSKSTIHITPAQTADHIGPGSYSVSQTQLKPRSPSVSLGARRFKNDSRSPFRPSTNGAENADFSHKPFGSDVKSFTIGAKRQEKRDTVPGPGQYLHDLNRAESMTKVKNPAVRFDSGCERPNHFVKKDMNYAEPGTYQVQKEFGSNAKSFKMGASTPRVTKIESQHLGPGVYDVTKAFEATKPRVVQVKIDPLPECY